MRVIGRLGRAERCIRCFTLERKKEKAKHILGHDKVKSGEVAMKLLQIGKEGGLLTLGNGAKRVGKSVARVRIASDFRLREKKRSERVVTIECGLEISQLKSTAIKERSTIAIKPKIVEHSSGKGRESDEGRKVG